MSEKEPDSSVCPVSPGGPAPWYRHPVIGVLVGLAVIAVMANVVFGFASGLGLLLTYAVFAVPVSLIAGFIVGAILGRNGMKWAAVASGLFTLVIAVYFSITPGGFDFVSLIRLIPLGILPTAIAMIGGKLGECSCRCRA